MMKHVIATTKNDIPPGVEPISVTIPPGATVIPPIAFAECPNLVEIIIPDGVLAIGQAAFEKCPALSSVTIADSVTRIEVGAFSECGGLRTVHLPKYLQTVKAALFENSALEAITIPQYAWRIGGSAFRGCSQLVSVDLHPDARLQDIADYAFIDCTNLKEIVLPPSLQTISQCAFARCTSLKTVKLSNFVYSIGLRAFGGCTQLESINIPSGSREILSGAFLKCCNLTSIEIPQSITTIGAKAFNGCDYLVAATILTRNVDVKSVQWRGLPDLRSCPHLRLLLAPALIDIERFKSGKLEVVSDTPANRARVATLRFWSRRTHHLCSAPRREWVVAVLLVAHRLSSNRLHLPPEMWEAILEKLLRSDLGNT